MLGRENLLLFLVVILRAMNSVTGMSQRGKYVIDVDTTEKVSVLKHFWESTGMCPPLPHQRAADFYLSEEMTQNIMYIGSVPHSGLKQVRMHWLLDMVTYDEGKETYNFTNLDALLLMLHKYKLKPGFELMGSPSNKFTNFDNHQQVLGWMKLVSELAQRYVKVFGLENVSQWNFETWNEPDHHDFDNVTMTVNGFLKYYDACSEGLKAVDETLVFGGPGGSCRKESFSERCWALLPHCFEGINYITGKKGSRIDFISMHKKGAGKADYILQTEMETISKIHKMYPALEAVPIFNDEGDPMVGWSHPYPWRADATYPAIVAKVIAQHQNKIIANSSEPTNYALLSNDNGFLSYSPNYFSQRTLTARFQMNHTRPHYVHLVRKPVHSIMGLLSKLGDTQVKTVVRNTYADDDFVGSITSVCENRACPSKEIVVLTYASADTSLVSDNFLVYLNVHGVDAVGNGSTSGSVMLMRCDINNYVSNPAKLWKDAGSPDFPNNELFIAMHNASEPLCTEPVKVDVSLGLLQLSVDLPLPGIMLHQICWKPPSHPAAPILLSVHNITAGQVLITWDDSQIFTKCIKTYEVQLCSDTDCTAVKKLNSYNIIFNSFVYISPSGSDKDVTGLYRARVVDFWGRCSAFSKGLLYPVMV